MYKDLSAGVAEVGIRFKKEGDELTVAFGTRGGQQFK